MLEEYGKMLVGGFNMILFSEYQTEGIDLVLDFYGYEDCPSNYAFGPAIRENFVLHYIDKGRGTFHYKDQVISLKAGDMFLLKPNELTYYQADKTNPWSYYWLGISGDKSHDYFGLSQIYQDGFLQQTDQYATGKIGQLIENIIRKAEIKSSTPLNHLYILGQMYELLFQLGKAFPNTHQINKKNPAVQLYLDTKHIIETRYPNEQLQIQTIAKELNVNRSYLTSVFKENHNLSPKEYLLFTRMKRAKQLLENTKESVKTVAHSVGFSDPLNFSKSFKKFFQYPPSQRRNQ